MGGRLTALREAGSSMTVGGMHRAAVDVRCTGLTHAESLVRHNRVARWMADTTSGQQEQPEIHRRRDDIAHRRSLETLRHSAKSILVHRRLRPIEMRHLYRDWAAGLGSPQGCVGWRGKEASEANHGGLPDRDVMTIVMSRTMERKASELA
jgi:hypothetical protein